MTWLLYLGIGLLAGVTGGYFGVGGAVIIIPLLVMTAKFPQHLAQGTSLGALLLPIGLLATYKYWQNGHVNIQAALGIAIGFFIGGWFGGSLAQMVTGPSLRRAFGALLIVAGLRMVIGK